MKELVKHQQNLGKNLIKMTKKSRKLIKNNEKIYENLIKI